MKDVITFDSKKCFQCGLCPVKCPAGAIVMEEKE
ncbi:MAG: 4Fe-4S binding protein [Bacilli bacterium]